MVGQSDSDSINGTDVVVAEMVVAEIVVPEALVAEALVTEAGLGEAALWTVVRDGPTASEFIADWAESDVEALPQPAATSTARVTPSNLAVVTPARFVLLLIFPPGK